MSNSLVCELICTRLSHDIVGNIGAVSNAVELLEEGDMEFIDDIKSILGVSSKNLASRLKFFRMAFGLKNANLESKEAVVKTAQDYLLSIGNKDFPITLIYDVKHLENVKNSLLMIMIMGDVLIRGGVINVAEEDNVLVAKIDANVKLSNDKLEKISSVLANNGQTSDAGLAPVAALCEYNPNKQIKMLNDGACITLSMEF